MCYTRCAHGASDKSPDSLFFTYMYISLVNSYKSGHEPPEWPISWLQILQFVFRVLSTPTASRASSCRSVNTPEILFKAHPLVIQRANGCGRLQLAQLCLGFAWMLYLECWILLPAENQKHQQWSVPAPLRFVLCHICCAVGFFSNAGLYIQVSTVPWEDKHSLPNSALSTWCRSAAFLLEAVLGLFPEFVLVYCFFFFGFNFQFIYVLIPWEFYTCL